MLRKNIFKQIKKQFGFNLIELTIVMLILSIAATAVFRGLLTGLEGTATITEEETALTIAESRMAFILGQFNENGFSSFSDLCVSSPSLPICSVTSGYTVSSTITSNYSGNANFKLITVTASGPGSATLTTMVTNYQ